MTRGKFFDPAIGNTFHDYRLDAGLTQAKVADMTGLSRSYINDIERHRASPSIETLKKLASALGVSVHAFINAPIRNDEKLTTGELIDAIEVNLSTILVRMDMLKSRLGYGS